MRSPGLCPGSPHIHSSSRSRRSWASVTPNASAASATRIPGRASRYGTRASRRGIRSAAPLTSDSGPALDPASGGGRVRARVGPQHRLDRFDELRRLEGDGSWTGRRDDPGELAGIGEVDHQYVVGGDVLAGHPPQSSAPRVVYAYPRGMHLVRGSAADVAEQVDTLGPLDRSGGSDRPDWSGHAGQAERPGIGPVAVEPDDVPAAPPGQHAPGLDRACLRFGGPGLEVVEAHRPRYPAPPRSSAGRPGSLASTCGTAPGAARCVHLDAAGAQLDQRGAGSAAERRRLPEPRGQADRGRLGGVEFDLRAARSRGGRSDSRPRCRSSCSARSRAGCRVRAARPCRARTSA